MPPGLPPRPVGPYRRLPARHPALDEPLPRDPIPGPIPPGPGQPPPLPPFPNAPGGGHNAPGAFGLGGRVDTQNPFTPASIAAAGFFGLGAYAVARQTGGGALGGQVEEPPRAAPGAALPGPPPLSPEPLVDADTQRLRDTLADQRRREFENREVLSDLGEWLGDSVAGKLAQRAVGLGKAPFELGRALLTPRAAGGGEEDEIARQNAANAALRQQFARLVFAALAFAPPAGGAGPAVAMPPIWEADP